MIASIDYGLNAGRTLQPSSAFAARREVAACMVRYCAGKLPLLMLLWAVFPAWAQDYPTKPIRWIVSFSAGGSTDIIARLVGAKLAEAWGYPVVIENRGGAGGTIAAAITAKAPPDGYTLLYVSAAHVIAPSVYKSLPFDPVTSFSAISVIANSPFVLVVSPALQVGSVAELIALAKAKPGTLTFASSGIGASNHLAGELFKIMAGVAITHIPYKGQGDTSADLMSGLVSMTFGSPPQALPLIAAGKVKVVGVSSKTRYAPLPDVPTIEEAGLPGYEATTWHGALAPLGTPARIVEKLQREMARALKAPDIRSRLATIGVTPIGSTVEEFSTLLKSDAVRWREVAKRSGVVPE